MMKGNMLKQSKAQPQLFGVDCNPEDSIIIAFYIIFLKRNSQQKCLRYLMSSKNIGMDINKIQNEMRQVRKPQAEMTELKNL